jgi:hypothetical protein
VRTARSADVVLVGGISCSFVREDGSVFDGNDYFQPLSGESLLMGGELMTEYIVGLRHGKRSEVLTIEAEDALIAALKAKHNHPEAFISYVRKSNRRGDRRNPHRKE